MHAYARDFWGYASAETLDNAAMIAEQYRGIRPAPGYPACPDHLVKQDMFDVLQAGGIGMSVTESLAMLPAASVSGFYMAHPDSTYFSVGKIGDDQVESFRATHVAVKEGRRARAGTVALTNIRTGHLISEKHRALQSGIFLFP